MPPKTQKAKKEVAKAVGKAIGKELAKTNRKARRQHLQPKASAPKKLNSHLKALNHGVGMERWVNSIMNPFNKTGVKVPDERTNFSINLRTGSLSEIQGVVCNSSSDPIDVSSWNLALLLSPHVNMPTGFWNISTDVSSGLFNFNTDATYGPPTAYPFTNYNAMYPDNNTTGGNSFQTRPVSIGIRITYLGKELDRSGEYVACLVPMAVKAFTASTTIPKAAMFDITNYQPTLTQIMTKSIKVERRRITNATETFFWQPNGAPDYCRVGSSDVVTTGMSDDMDLTQYCLFVCAYGVALPATNTITTHDVNSYVGLPFRVDTVWNIETSCVGQFNHVIAPSPSPYDVAALQHTINKMQEISFRHRGSGGSTMSLGNLKGKGKMKEDSHEDETVYPGTTDAEDEPSSIKPSALNRYSSAAADIIDKKAGVPIVNTIVNGLATAAVAGLLRPVRNHGYNPV